MTNRSMKTYFSPLIIREMKFRTAMKYHFMSMRLALKLCWQTSAGNVWGKKFLFGVGENVLQFILFGNIMNTFQKLRIETFVEPRNFISWNPALRLQNHYFKNTAILMITAVDGKHSKRRKNPSANYMWKVNTHNRILLSYKKSWNYAICCNMMDLKATIAAEISSTRWENI